MGKRKLHGQTYFQCDWTGLPMRHRNCYMPDWNENGKFLKHGSYTCWEAVMAHAEEQLLSMHSVGANLPAQSEKFKRIQEHINDLVGCNVVAAPHWSTLAWLKNTHPVDLNESGEIKSPKQFYDACCKMAAPIVAVRIPAAGDPHEVLCNSEDVQGKFAQHISKPFISSGDHPQSFQVVRKKANKDRDITVFYWPFKNGLQFNNTASNAFKMQIYGDALVVQQTKEPCFLPRERFVNYYVASFHEQFSHKTKRKDAQLTLSTDEYALAKAEMSSQLEYLESVASANASSPADLAKAAVLPPPSGKELSSLLRARGQSPPLKRARSTVSAQTSPTALNAEPVAA
tara:strand:- start:54 stop:1082 length:1029 start_codon:yes stop_codon:yes gene_type:complete